MQAVQQQTEPITQKISPRRQEAARHYGSHPYFTRRAWNVVQAYIRHFTSEGDVVLDPFGGSGVTAIEALILRRKAIHVDINPLANFITEQVAVSPVDLGALREAFGRVSDQCAALLADWKKRSDPYFEEREIPFWCPAGTALPRNSDAPHLEDLFTRRQLFVLSLILDRIKDEKDNQLRGLLLFCFSATLAKTNRTFISARNRAESRGGPTIFSVYRYAIPRKPVELDPWEQFEARFANVLLCKRETNKFIGDFYSPRTCQIIQGSASSLTDLIKPQSIDYVFTDPPYGAHIAYLDLSTMWNAWLGFQVTKTDREQELIVGGELRHSKEHYLTLLRDSIRQISKVLKPGAWFSLVFEHKNVSFYSAIVEVGEEIGLRHANTVVQSLDVVWSMHKKKNPLSVLSGELILNFQKSGTRRPKSVPRRSVDLENLIEEVARENIGTHGSARTEDLFHGFMVRLMDSGFVHDEKATFDSLLQGLLSNGFRFDLKTGRWHLGETPPRTQPILPFH